MPLQSTAIKAGNANVPSFLLLEHIILCFGWLPAIWTVPPQLHPYPSVATTSKSLIAMLPSISLGFNKHLIVIVKSVCYVETVFSGISYLLQKQKQNSFQMTWLAQCSEYQTQFLNTAYTNLYHHVAFMQFREVSTVSPYGWYNSLSKYCCRKVLQNYLLACVKWPATVFQLLCRTQCYWSILLGK